MEAFIATPLRLLPAKERVPSGPTKNEENHLHTHIELSAYNLVTFPRVRVGAQAQSAVEGGSRVASVKEC